jgi:FAD synthetase
MAFGSFDILHPGHVDYLGRAKRLGDYLIVVVARSDSIKRIKGRAPFFDDRERLRMVGSLGVVDRAILGNPMRNPDDKYAIIREYRPDIVVFGYDQRVDVAEVRDWLRRKGIGARVVKLRHGLRPRRYKSSRIRGALER